jgi:peptidoglycan/xylan/chitin deacetylase (PgdA/CDA1 family)
MSGERLRCFVVHAERLNRDQVWDRTLQVLDLLEAAGGRGTLFVHPFEAIQTGFDLAPRIEELLARGHEIAQHTHFYAPKALGDLGKPLADTSRENVLRCLDRDHAELVRCGADPRGFTSGGWLIDDTAIAWVTERGFRFDCSYRSFDLHYENPRAARGQATRPVLAGSVIRLPTTMTLREAAAGLHRRGGVMKLKDLSYQLVYTHDHDLVQPMRGFAARRVIKRWSRHPGRWVTVSEVAELIRARMESP